MRVRFSPSGRLQFLSAVAHIRGENPAAARRFLGKAGRILRRLGRHPHSGRVIPEFPDLPFREVIITPYRFFYRVQGSVVWIAAVWHGAQLPRDPRGRRARR